MFGIRFWFKFLTGFWHLVQLGSLLSIKLILERSLASPYSKIQSSLYHTTRREFSFLKSNVYRICPIQGRSTGHSGTFSHTAWIAVWDYTYLMRTFRIMSFYELFKLKLYFRYIIYRIFRIGPRFFIWSGLVRGFIFFSLILVWFGRRYADFFGSSPVLIFFGPIMDSFTFYKVTTFIRVKHYYCNVCY